MRRHASIIHVPQVIFIPLEQHRSLPDLRIVICGGAGLVDGGDVVFEQVLPFCGFTTRFTCGRGREDGRTEREDDVEAYKGEEGYGEGPAGDGAACQHCGYAYGGWQLLGVRIVWGRSPIDASSAGRRVTNCWNIPCRSFISSMIIETSDHSSSQRFSPRSEKQYLG